MVRTDSWRSPASLVASKPIVESGENPSNLEEMAIWL